MRRFSDFANKYITIYCRVVTAVCIVVPCYMQWCVKGDAIVFGSNDLWSLLIVAAICTLGSSLLMGEKMDDTPKRRFLLQKILCFLYNNTIVLISGYLLHWFYPSEKVQVIGMELMILLVYILITAACYLGDVKMTDQMNSRLKQRGHRD